jgi:hypothetical protein
MTLRLTLQCGVTNIPAKHSVVFIRSQHEWCWGHVGIILYVSELYSCAGKDFVLSTLLQFLCNIEFCSGFV